MVVGTAAVVLCIASGTAEASLYLIFDRTSAQPGAVIHARTGGQGAFSAGSPGHMPLFLVPARQADRITSRADPALVRLGKLVVDEDGDGKATFVVPDVPAGRYLAMIHCRACAESSAGLTMLVVGPFEEPFTVLPGASPIPSGLDPITAADSPGSIRVWSMWSFVLVATAALMWLAVRRLRTSSSK